MTEKVTEVVRAFRSGVGSSPVGGGAYWCATRYSSTGIIGSSGFGYEFRALETASISNLAAMPKKIPAL